MARIYLDHNATTPLGDGARAAMIAAMDIVGNPSSVHSEGRAAKAIIELAREQVAISMGAADADVIFVASATEAAALAMRGRGLKCALIEHDAVSAWGSCDLLADAKGFVTVDDPASTSLQFASGETGIIQDIPKGLAVCDATQGFGKIAFDFAGSDLQMALVSAHKIGGPKGVGALVIKRGTDLSAQIIGGGQESGRRAGTENVIGIAGFGAAAFAASQAIKNDVWARVEKLRDLLEDALATDAKDTIFVGKGVRRLPNTSCLITPNWKGETQVMQMDLAGIAVSAGSACSSGKVRPSMVLRAMGYDDVAASSAVRISLGPKTTEQDVMRFAEVWLRHHAKFSEKTTSVAA